MLNAALPNHRAARLAGVVNEHRLELGEEIEALNVHALVQYEFSGEQRIEPTRNQRYSFRLFFWKGHPSLIDSIC